MLTRSMIARVCRLEERAARLERARWFLDSDYSRVERRVIEDFTEYFIDRCPNYPSSTAWQYVKLPAHQAAMFRRAAKNEFKAWLSETYPYPRFSNLEPYEPLVFGLAEMIYDEVINGGVPIAKRRHFFHPETWATFEIADDQAEGGRKRAYVFLLIRAPVGKLLRQARALAEAWSQLPVRLRRIGVHESARTATPLEYVTLLNEPQM